MIIATTPREHFGSKPMRSQSFEISSENAAHIMGILRSTLYTDKPLAVLREYGSNAWDEHREAGIPNVPIKVHLPTALNPFLKIRDFGRGLSADRAQEILTQYGLSTKRETNLSSGTLGIGFKSGFTYTDAFTVTSYHQGMKSVFFASLDPSEKGRLDLMSSEPCGDETGLEIQIPIKPEDIPAFQDTAAHLFRWFSPQPDINISLAPFPEMRLLPELGGQGMLGGTRSWVLLMGCVPYQIDLRILKPALGEDLYDILGYRGGVLVVPMGAVQFSANREGLQYTPSTIQVVSRGLQELWKGVSDKLTQQIDDPLLSWWDRRLAYRELRSWLPLGRSETHEHLSGVEVNLPQAKTFSFRHNNPRRNKKVIVGRSRLLLSPSRRVPSWSGIQSEDIWVIPRNMSTPTAEIRAELDTLLESWWLTGIPILPVEGVPATPQKPRAPRVPQPKKQHARVFTGRKWAHAEVPSDPHPYLILKKTGSVFVNTEVRTEKISEMLKVRSHLKLPAVSICGYTSVEKVPTHATPFSDWWEKSLRECQALMRQEILAYEWERVTYYDRLRRDGKSSLSGLTLSLGKDLGPEHVFTQYFTKLRDGATYVHSSDYVETLIQLLKRPRVAWDVEHPVQWAQGLQKRYPMLGVVSTREYSWYLGFQDPKSYATLVAYIQEQDALLEGTNLSVEKPCNS